MDGNRGEDNKEHGGARHLKREVGQFLNRDRGTAPMRLLTAWPVSCGNPQRSTYCPTAELSGLSEGIDERHALDLATVLEVL